MKIRIGVILILLLVLISCNQVSTNSSNFESDKDEDTNTNVDTGQETTPTFSAGWWVHRYYQIISNSKIMAQTYIEYDENKNVIDVYPTNDVSPYDNRSYNFDVIISKTPNTSSYVNPIFEKTDDPRFEIDTTPIPTPTFSAGWWLHCYYYFPLSFSDSKLMAKTYIKYDENKNVIDVHPAKASSTYDSPSYNFDVIISNTPNDCSYVNPVFKKIDNPTFRD